MSYKGSINPVGGFDGKVKKKSPSFNIGIIPIKKFSNAGIRPILKYKTSVKKYSYFDAFVKKLNVIFHFLSVKSTIFEKHKSNAISAEAVDVEVYSTIQASKEAPLIPNPANGIVVNQKERLSVSAKLVAYRRAVCKYIKKLFFKTTAKLQSALGAVTKYIKAIKLKLTSKAIAAESAIVESKFNEVQIGCEAAGSSAPAHIVPEIESTFSAERKAKASTAAVVPVNIDSLPEVAHSAKMATWIEPVVVDGMLILRQVYSATPKNNILVVE